QDQDTEKTLPMGFADLGGSFVWGTWQMLILPYIEEDNLHYVNFSNRDNTGIWYYAPPNDENVTKHRLWLLTCPSDKPSEWWYDHLTLHNYVVNHGNTGFNQVDWSNGPRFGGAPFSYSKAF